MGAMSTCMTGINPHSAREVQFNLINSPSPSFREKQKQYLLKQKNNSQIFVPLKKEIEYEEKKNEINNVNKMKKIENIIDKNIKNNIIYSTRQKIKGKNNVCIKKKLLESTEDFCDIIECEDEFECDKNLSGSINLKNKELLNEKRVNYLPIQNLIINNIPNIKSDTITKENGGNILNDGEKQLIIKDYFDKDKTNNNYNINMLKISKQNNISFSKINEGTLNKNDENDNIKEKIKSFDDNIINSNNKNKDFQNCKIDNNISFNINNSIIKNNINNISSMNSDLNNNNYLDISNNMTYYLSLDKSLRRPATTRFDNKEIISFQKNNENLINNNNKEMKTNDYRNSERVNKYKWKLLPKHKYKTQVYKSINNIPSSKESLLINEEEQKNVNLNMTNITPINSKGENSTVISEIKRQKEQQDKLIKSLENKIKNLEKKINEENMNKINDKKILKNNLINNKLVESQKDVRIKKLEEQLNTVKKSNKLNKTLLKQKDEQIKNLIEKKNKQDEFIKKHEIDKIHKDIKPKNMNHTTKAKNNKINYMEDLSGSYNPNQFNNNLTTTNNNLIESKLSITNLNNSINMKLTKKLTNESVNNKIKKFHKKGKSVNIQKHFFKSNSANLEEYCSSEPENEHVKINSSMRESSINISYSKYCNDLYNKEKKNYSNKITLNKMKIYKLNKSQKLTLNTESKYNQFYIPSKKYKKQNKIEEINKELNLSDNNSNSELTKKNKKKFSFTKSKKLLRKKSEKDLKEMYLLAGTAQNEETNSANPNINTNSDVKLITHNDILFLTHKNSFTNSGGDTTITYKNYGINFSNDEKLNENNNNNNINGFNSYLKSNSNEIIDKSDKNKTYQKLYNEGYLRFKQLSIGKKKVEEKKLNNNYIYRLQFCMANDLYELKVDKRDLMFDVKYKFLKEFFKKKNYGEGEKKYIKDNIIFLKKDGIINLNRKVYENNLNNNEVIIPALKDMT